MLKRTLSILNAKNYSMTKAIINSVAIRCYCDRPPQDKVSINEVRLMGRVGQDPEKNGNYTVTFPLATNLSFGAPAKDGKRPVRTDWHRVVAGSFSTKEYVYDNVKTGDRVLVMGSARNDRYTDDEGTQRYYNFIRADRVMIVTKRAAADEDAATDTAVDEDAATDTAKDTATDEDTTIRW